jgi:hypothetical protein
MDKFLLVGVGGSGGKTLRYIWRELDRRLTDLEWQGGVPAAWRFVHIDLPHDPDVIEGDVPASMGNAKASYLGLGRIGRAYREYDGDLVKRDHLPALAGWRPNPTDAIPPPYLGAGQRRSVGRIVALSQLKEVGTELQRALRDLGTTDVTSELMALATELGQKPPAGQKTVRVIVISSLGGGSGSGAFLDVVELIKTLPESQAIRDELITILYAPDVFNELDPMKRMGIEPNTLAALSELIAGDEHRGGLPDVDGELLSDGGGTHLNMGQRTAPYNFFIGSRNDAITFTTSHQVYQSVAKAMAAFIVNDEMRKDFGNYGINVTAASVTSEFGITDPAPLNRPGRSFGYASVTLGNTLFEKYATERLAKAAVERLLRAHRENTAQALPRSNDVLIMERAEQQLNDFLNASGLREYTTEHNQVLDELRKPEEKRARVKALAETVTHDLESRGERKSPKEWLASFKATFKARERDFVDAERNDRRQRAAQWSGDVQNKLLETVAASIGTNGLPVTQRLLELLQQDVEKAAVELDRSSAMHREDADRRLNKATGLIGSLRERVIAATHGSFGDAARESATGLFLRTEAELHQFTAGLLREAAIGLLPPLRAALAQAYASLRTVAEDDEELQQWSLRAVPPHLQPAPNELLLEDHERFPERLDELLSIQFRAVAEQAQSEALRELISGAWEHPGEPTHQRLIAGAGSWASSVTGAGTKNGVFQLALDPAAVRDAARAWVTERNEGEVRNAVRGSLADWLKQDQPDAAARANRFADAIEMALAASAPLVSINPETYTFVHGDQIPAGTPAVGAIPIDTKHPAFPRVSEALNAHGLNEKEISNHMRPGTRASAVEISSFVGVAMHPVVFASIFDPIQADWKGRHGAQDRRQFWQFRRTRPLESFVPLARWRLRALIRGWLTANVLGHVPRLERPWSERPLSIWTPRGWLPFPKDLLGRDVARHGLVLPALVESFPLALLELSGGNHGSLGAYLRLLHLGRADFDADGGSGEVYSHAHPDLVEWLTLGRLAEPQPGFEPPPAPVEAVAGSVESTAEERLAAVRHAISEYRKRYAEVDETVITQETSLTVNRTWEIRGPAIKAADELAEAVARVAKPDPVADGFM